LRHKIKENLNTKNLYRVDKATNTAFIDVNINFYREIYNEWDFSPYINRDLDDDLFEYLENCAEEIPSKHNLAIVFHIPVHIKNPEKEENSITGFKNYFRYQIRKLRTAQVKLVKRIIKYGIFGILLIYLGNRLSLHIEMDNIFRFLVDGLFIGGWVLFWELFSTLFFKQSDIRAQKRILYRLCNAELTYQYKEQTVADYKEHLQNPESQP